MPSPNGGLARRRSTRVVERVAAASSIAIAAVERAVGVVVVRHRRAEARHHRVADELHHRAALVEDRVVHLGAVLVELDGELDGVAALGDAE